MTADIATLTRLINNEVILAMGLPPRSWAARRLQPLLSRATIRFSEIFAAADRIVAEAGIAAAAQWVLQRLAEGSTARGVQNIPDEGPLIIASNHPGAVDSLAIGAHVSRDDLKIMASDVPFLTHLTNVARHLIFLPRQGIQARMLAVREGIRHLQQGGAVLLFAHGTIDPDPSFMPQADRELDAWSRSLEVFVRKVPETRVVTTIVSNVIDPRYMRHPLTWIKRNRVDRQRLAMMLQIIHEMLGRTVELTPRVSFGEAIDWQTAKVEGNSLRVVVEAAKRLLRAHLAWLQ